jgi:hypothetical protein
MRERERAMEGDRHNAPINLGGEMSEWPWGRSAKKCSLPLECVCVIVCACTLCALENVAVYACM